MPDKMEAQLKAEVERDHPDWPQERKDKYIYGTLRNAGWRPHVLRSRRAQEHKQ